MVTTHLTGLPFVALLVRLGPPGIVEQVLLMRSLRILMSLRTGFVLMLGMVLMGTHAHAVTDRSPAIYKSLCAQCHGDKGEGNESIDAPAIAGLGEWYVKAQLIKFRDGARGTHPLDIAGTRMAPMARFLRTDADLDNVSRFVSTMKTTPLKNTLKGGSIVKGEQRYQICAACHGADGSGNQQTGGPRLTGAGDWYLLKQLKNFKSGARGSDAARDPMGAAMRANALTLDDQAMLDVIAYINTLSND